MLHDQISLGQINQISFKEMDPFRLAGVIRRSFTFLLCENFLSSLEYNVQSLFSFPFTSLAEGKHTCKQRRI